MSSRGFGVLEARSYWKDTVSFIFYGRLRAVEISSRLFRVAFLIEQSKVQSIYEELVPLIDPNRCIKHDEALKTNKMKKEFPVSSFHAFSICNNEFKIAIALAPTMNNHFDRKFTMSILFKSSINVNRNKKYKIKFPPETSWRVEYLCVGILRLVAIDEHSRVVIFSLWFSAFAENRCSWFILLFFFFSVQLQLRLNMK